MMQTLGEEWDPNEHQGRSQEQVEGDMTVAGWVGMLFILMVVAIIASAIGQKLFLWLVPFLQKL
ncbi:MAG: hypothetical protein WAV25_00775 [Minisyncoccia bacterium]